MKKLIALTIFVSITVCSGSAMSLPMQWESSSGGNDHWYHVVLLEPVLTWEDAMAAASAAGGYLATITSEAENDFLVALLAADPDPARYWLGGYQTSPGSDEPSGNWAWVTGEPWGGYEPWYPGEPNNGMGGTQNYLHYWPTAGQWDDMENGRYMAGYIMEVGSVPEPSTWLLIGTGIVGIATLSGSRIRKKK